MKIGILQTGIAADALIETHGDYPDSFAQLLDGRGFEFQTFAVVNGVFPGSVNDCDGWLITGSKHGAYEDHAWIPPLEHLIRDIYAADLPMIGVCFGHQIIAQALGGKVEKFDGGWGVGRFTYTDADGDNPITLNAYHQDQVIKVPDSVTAVQGNEFCENAILTYGNKAFTMQPHPEFSTQYILDLFEHRAIGVIDPTIIDAAKVKLVDNTDAQIAAEKFEKFFKRVV